MIDTNDLKRVFVTERSLAMSSVAYVGEKLQQILQERANALAKETGCVIRVTKFTGAALLQTLVFGWQQHPDASLEQLASTAQLGDVSVWDTAVHKRFTEPCAHFLHRVLEEMSTVVVQAAHEVPVKLLRRFSMVVLEDSSSIALPDELAQVWRGCGGTQAHTAAAVKLHTRWELKRGQIQGPQLTDGRSSDQASPFKDEEVVPGSLLISDLGYFNLRQMAARQQAGGYTLSRLKAGIALFTREGKRVHVDSRLLPPRVGQMKELQVLVGASERLPMRLLLQQWLIILFAWHDPQRSLVKLAQVVRDTSWILMDALARKGSVRSALRLIGRRMGSGCQMNKRKKHPNSAQLLQQQAVEWALSWCE
jgi:hypothetical protein